MINYFLGLGAGAIGLIILQAVNNYHYKRLLEETEDLLDELDELYHRSFINKKQIKRLVAENNRLQAELADLRGEPEVVEIVKINDKAKESKPWCAF